MHRVLYIIVKSSHRVESRRNIFLVFDDIKDMSRCFPCDFSFLFPELTKVGSVDVQSSVCAFKLSHFIIEN